MTCQDKSPLAPALASTPVIPRRRQNHTQTGCAHVSYCVGDDVGFTDGGCNPRVFGLPLSGHGRRFFNSEKVNAALPSLLFGISPAP